MINDFGEVIQNASLEKYNTYGIKTSSRYLVKPDSIENLINLLNYLDKNNIKYYLLGKGSNVILPDYQFDGAIISLEKLNKVEIDNNIVVAQAGIILAKLVNKTITSGLSGLEYLGTIPGTLGGALFGNAGVKDHDIYEYLKEIEVIKDNKLIKIKKNDIDYSYRDTEFKRSSVIIVRATFELEKGNGEKMKEIIASAMKKRLLTQPLEYKNAGSVFKNPEGTFAGKLIEEAGLKDYHINDAYVSSKHANFIVNKNNATSQDIINLIQYIKEKVKEKFNIELELEQMIVRW